MTTRLGHIADLAEHQRVHGGDWMPAPRRAETPTAAIDRGGRSHTDRAAIRLPDRAPVSNTPAASALPERDVRTTVRSVLPHTVTSREIRATTPEPSPPKQQSPASNGDVASAPAPAPDRPVTRPASPPTPSRQAVAERTPQFDVPALSAISPPSSPAVPESPVVDTSGPPFGPDGSRRESRQGRSARARRESRACRESGARRESRASRARRTPRPDRASRPCGQNRTSREDRAPRPAPEGRARRKGRARRAARAHRPARAERPALTRHTLRP